MKEKPPEKVPPEFRARPKTTADVSLPAKYVKPMADMVNRFTETTLTPGAACSPIAVAVAIAIVIVLWDRPLSEMVLTAEDKEALKFAVEQIKADPEGVRRVTGIELTGPHVKLMETLAL